MNGYEVYEQDMRGEGVDPTFQSSQSSDSLELSIHTYSNEGMPFGVCCAILIKKSCAHSTTAN